MQQIWSKNIYRTCNLNAPLTDFDTRTTKQCLKTLRRLYWLENLKEQVSPCKLQILSWVFQYSFFQFSDSGCSFRLKPKTFLEKHNLISMFKPFQSSAFHIETSSSICCADQVNGFCMKWNAWLKWVKMANLLEIFCENLSVERKLIYGSLSN